MTFIDDIKALATKLVKEHGPDIDHLTVGYLKQEMDKVGIDGSDYNILILVGALERETES